MNCDQCAKCCKEGNISLIYFEFLNLQKMKKFDYIYDPYFPKMKFPCAFLDKNNKCSIYENRPLICRCFPLKYFIDGSILHFGIHPDCKYADNLIKEMDKNPKHDIIKVLSENTIKTDDISLCYNSILSKEAIGNLIPSFLNEKEKEEFWNILKLIEENEKNSKIRQIPILFQRNMIDYVLEIQKKQNSFSESKDYLNNALKQYREQYDNQLK